MYITKYYWMMLNYCYFFQLLNNNLTSSNNILLCTLDKVGFYPNILHGEELSALTKILNKR